MQCPWRISTGFKLLPARHRRGQRGQILVEKRRILAGLFLDFLFDVACGLSRGNVRDGRVDRVQLVLKKDLPVVVLHNAEAIIDDFYFAIRRPIAHVVKGATAGAKPFFKTWSSLGKARENKATEAADPRGTLDVRFWVAFAKPRILVTVRRRHSRQLTIEPELPGMVRADEQAAGIAFVFVAERGAPMRTSIVQDIDFAVGAAHEKHWLAADHEGDIIARIADLGYMTCIDPGLVEDILELLLKDYFIGVTAAMNAIGLHKRTSVRGNRKRLC